jgi:hypothetical protein
MRFSIRHLLLVTMIVALAVGWWADRSRLANLLRAEKVFNESLREPEPDWTNQPNSSALSPNSPKP